VLHDDAKGHTNCNTGVCNGANTGENGYGAPRRVASFYPTMQ
jgi:hypothetical protein